MSDTNEKSNWLTGLLTGWGIKESWAKIIAGAIIGALTAAGILTAQSCSADANISFSSEQGMLSVSRAGDGGIVISATPAVVVPSKK